MQTFENDKNLCNDRWLSALVDAMDEVESLRSDDFCRGADIPAGLMAQLRGNAFAAHAQRPAAKRIQFA